MIFSRVGRDGAVIRFAEFWFDLTIARRTLRRAFYFVEEKLCTNHTLAVNCAWSMLGSRLPWLAGFTGAVIMAE
jgi:hypothetical protein